MIRMGVGEPKRLGPYRLVGRLPDGPLGGPVYLGRRQGGVQASVMVVPVALARDLRFRADVGSALALTGAGLAPLLGADLDGPVPWLADTFLPAVTLRQAVEQYGPLPWSSLSVLAPGLLEALATVHSAGFAYGLLTPGTVLLGVRAPVLAARVSGAAAQADDVPDLAAVLEFAAGGYVAPASVLLPLLEEAVDELRSHSGPEPLERAAVGRLVDLLGGPVAAPGGDWLPAPVAAAAAAVARVPGPSRRTLLVGAVGGALAVGGLATALAWPSGSGDGAPAPAPVDASSGGSPSGASPSRGSPSGGSPSGGSPVGSPSTAREVRVDLAGVQPATAWQVVLQDEPSDLAASDTVVALASQKSTLFVDRDGRQVFSPHSLTVFPTSSGLSRMTSADGVFYVLGDVRGRGSALAALDAGTGDPKWAMSLPALLGAENRPAAVAVEGRTVYVAAGKLSLGADINTPSTYTGVLAAFDVADGTMRWKTTGTDLSNILVPPSGNLLLAASAVDKPDGQVVMLDAGASGARGWKQTVPNGRWYYQPGPAMTCYAGGLFVFGADRIVAADPATGKQVWDLRADEQPDVRFGTPFASPDGRSVYVPVGQDLVALDAANGKARWVATLPKHVLWTAGLSLNGVHARCSADTVIATDSQRNLWAIDADTGRARWKYNDPAAPPVGFRWTVAGDRVYVSSNLTLTAIATHG
ncbi:PQQ-binding-like beta-propeller repeat protein [Kitasatospora sp. NPDC004745]|uniref:outer membrane protein assembly factor BamB family protein n=1 Tax=Kitasatospora sp. NPDC004745 TaxID=3364019 RepID=UPI0036903F6E